MGQEKKTEKTSPVRESIRLILAGSALAICYFIHWFPFDFLAIAKRLPLWGTLASIGVLAALRIILPRISEKAYRITGIVYYVTVGLYGLAIAYFVWMLDPLFFAGFVPFMAAFFAYLKYMPDKRLPMLGFVGLVAVYVARFPFWPIAIIGIGILVMAMPGFFLVSPKRIGRSALFFAAFFALLIARFGYFYFGADESLLPKVTYQTGIERVLSIDYTNHPAWPQLTKQLRYAADNMAGTHTIIGSSACTMAIPKNFPFGTVLLEGTSSDGLVYDQDKKLLILGDYSNHRLGVFTDTLEMIDQTSAPPHDFTNLRYDPVRSQVITGDDYTSEVGLYSIKTGEISFLEDAPASRDALVDPKTGLIIAATLRRVYWIDPKSGKRVRTLRVPSLQIRLAADPEKRLLYVSSFSSGELWKVDLDTGQVADKLKIEQGVRFLKLSPYKTILFVSSYFSGNIFQVKVPEMTVEKTLFVGPRVRSMHIAPGSKKIVFTSSLGVFRYRF